MYIEERSDDTSMSAPEDTPIGRVDMDNLPGKLRKHLAASGQIDSSGFTPPPNTPGWKIKELREQYKQAHPSLSKRKKVKVAKKSEPEQEEDLGDVEVGGPDAIISYKEGDIVVYKGHATPVIAVDETRVKIKNPSTKEGGKKFMWVAQDRVRLAPEEE